MQLMINMKSSRKESISPSLNYSERLTCDVEHVHKTRKIRSPLKLPMSHLQITHLPADFSDTLTHERFAGGSGERLLLPNCNNNFIDIYIYHFDSLVL